MDNKKEHLTVIQDDNIAAEDYINVYTSNKETNFRKGMFVKIYKDNDFNSDYFWIGQIVTSNSNMSPVASNSTDQMMLSALESGEERKDVLDGFGHSLFFKVKLLKLCYTYEAEGKTRYDFEPINSRPSFGAKLFELEANEIIELLKVPEFKFFEQSKTGNALGYSQTIKDLPLCLTEKEFHTHILVSGTTGSGKSNVNANIIKIAKDLNKPVIIHDAKPDFEQIEFMNSESFAYPKSKRVIAQEKKYKFKEKGIDDVIKIGFEGVHDLINNSQAFYDAFIYFEPKDFTPEEFVKLFFYGEGEENQEEEFLSILKTHYEDIMTAKIKSEYNHNKLMKDLNSSIIISINKGNKENNGKYEYLSKEINKELLNDLTKIHISTRKTILQKLKRRILQYPWLRLEGSNKTTNTLPAKKYKDLVMKMYKISMSSDKGLMNKEKITEYYNKERDRIYKERKEKNKGELYKGDIIEFIKENIKNEKSPVFLIDYNFRNADITYSFIVNKLLKDIQTLQDNPEKASKTGVVQVVDEAHRLFSGLSKNFKDELIYSLGKVIKEGRVKKHSLVLSLQNASEVPDTALNNFGTKISLRQQSITEANISTQGMGDNAQKQVMNLSPGQFLIKYPSGEFTFLAFGFMSPCQLRVE